MNMTNTKTSITHDLNTAFKLPMSVCNTLVEKINLCIGSALHDAVLEKSDVAVINLGIGTLNIEIASFQCKFIPSKELKAIIKSAISGGVDPLLLELEQELTDQLIEICEGLI